MDFLVMNKLNLCRCERMDQHLRSPVMSGFYARMVGMSSIFLCW